MSDVYYDGSGSSGGYTVTVDPNIFSNLNNSNGGYSSQAAYEAHLQTELFKAQEQKDWANFEQPNVKGAGWSTSLDGHTITYNYNTSSNLYHSAFSVADILQQFGNSASAVNPYDKKVLYKETNDQQGGIHDYYMDNPAYKEFETLASKMQNIAYQTRLNAGQITNNKASQADLANLEAGRDNGLYGAGTLGIDSLAQNITDLKKQISDLQLADNLSSNYNRIDNTDHSKEIAALQAQLGAFQNQYDSATSDYDTRYALAKARQNEASKGEWTVHYGWVTDPTFDASFHFNMGHRQDTNGFTNLLLSGDINSWMAGGNLYDAPRAGDVMFNILGNMNTVRFLGIEDTNRFPDMVTEFANPEVFRSLGTMAGEHNFSVIPPIIYQ